MLFVCHVVEAQMLLLSAQIELRVVQCCSCIPMQAKKLHYVCMYKCSYTYTHTQMFVHMQCSYICVCFKINKYVCTHPHKYIDFCSYMYVCVRFCWQKQFLGAQNFLAPWPINGLYGNAACNNYR